MTTGMVKFMLAVVKTDLLASDKYIYKPFSKSCSSDYLTLDFSSRALAIFGLKLLYIYNYNCGGVFKLFMTANP